MIRIAYIWLVYHAWHWLPFRIWWPIEKHVLPLVGEWAFFGTWANGKDRPVKIGLLGYRYDD